MPDEATTTDDEIPGLAFLQYALGVLVEDADQLKIDGQIDDLGVLLTVQVSERDMGKVIGKGGQTIKALRTLIRVVGSQNAQRVNLKILEPPTSSSSEAAPAVEEASS